MLLPIDLFKFCLCLAALNGLYSYDQQHSSNARASPARVRLPHDLIAPLETNCNQNSTYAEWHPTMIVETDECVPFPAVSAKGELSGGLAVPFFPLIDPSRHCKWSRGQTYSRKHRHEDGSTVVVCCWYFPKGFDGRHAW